MSKRWLILVSDTVAPNVDQVSGLLSIGRLTLKGFAQEQEAYEWAQEGA